MAVGKFMKSGGLAALAAGLALIAVPASAQERGQGRWGGGDRGGGASAHQGGDAGSGRGSWGGGRGDGGGGSRGFRDNQSAGTPAPAPQAQAQPRQNWSRGAESRGGENRWSGNNGNGGDRWSRRDQARGNATTQMPAQVDNRGQGERRNWSGNNNGGQWQGQSRGEWQGRNRSYVDPNRNGTYRDTNRDNVNRDSANRWRGNSGWTGNRDRYAGGRDWNRDWRNDNRYDWRGYRSSNRNVYRLGQYYAPYRNYSYRRLSTGFYLDSLFFGSRYWINDPWQYRLPPADGGYRWVRYYDDALLVDTYSGEVVDVIYDFFW